MTNKQPTATAFVRKQISWSEFVLDKVQRRIKEREDVLRARGLSEDEFDLDDDLMDMYDEEMFLIRYAEEMEKQRRHLREKYFGED